MRLLIVILGLGIATGSLSAQASPNRFERPFRVIDSIPTPESVALGPDGAWYVSSFGKPGSPGDGAVYRVQPDSGTRQVYAGGLDDPAGLLFVGNTLWVADRGGVYRVTRGKSELAYAAAEFPRPLHFLNDLAVGSGGTLYVSDTGDSTVSGRGAVFVLTAGKPPSVLAGSDTARAVSSVNGLFRGAKDTIYTVGWRSGVLSATDGAGRWRELLVGLGGADGIEDAGTNAADLIVDRGRGWLVVPETEGNRLSLYQIGPSASR